MTNVVEFSPFTDDAPATPHRRLLQFSRALALLFAAFIVLSLLWLIAAFVVVFFFSSHVLVGAEGAQVAFPGIPALKPGLIRFSDQPFLTHLAGFVDIAIAMVPVIAICWHLRGLFRLYAEGIVFARENAARLKHVGLWLIAYPFIKFAANVLFRLAGGTDKAWAQMLFFDAFIFGLIVYAIAQVMEFGREIEQEKDSFI